MAEANLFGEPTTADLLQLAISTLKHVAEETCIGTDAEWHFKPYYDPQLVLDVIATLESVNT